jgi:hypothetical protein
MRKSVFHLIRFLLIVNIGILVLILIDNFVVRLIILFFTELNFLLFLAFTHKTEIALKEIKKD